MPKPLSHLPSCPAPFSTVSTSTYVASSASSPGSASRSPATITSQGNPSAAAYYLEPIPTVHGGNGGSPGPLSLSPVLTHSPLTMTSSYAHSSSSSRGHSTRPRLRSDTSSHYLSQLAGRAGETDRLPEGEEWVVEDASTVGFEKQEGKGWVFGLAVSKRSRRRDGRWAREKEFVIWRQWGEFVDLREALIVKFPHIEASLPRLSKSNLFAKFHKTTQSAQLRELDAFVSALYRLPPTITDSCVVRKAFSRDVPLASPVEYIEDGALGPLVGFDRVLSAGWVPRQLGSPNSSESENLRHDASDTLLSGGSFDRDQTATPRSHRHEADSSSTLNIVQGCPRPPIFADDPSDTSRSGASWQPQQCQSPLRSMTMQTLALATRHQDRSASPMKPTSAATMPRQSMESEKELLLLSAAALEYPEGDQQSRLPPSPQRPRVLRQYQSMQDLRNDNNDTSPTYQSTSPPSSAKPVGVAYSQSIESITLPFQNSHQQYRPRRDSDGNEGAAIRAGRHAIIPTSPIAHSPHRRHRVRHSPSSSDASLSFASPADSPSSISESGMGLGGGVAMSTASTESLVYSDTSFGSPRIPATPPSLDPRDISYGKYYRDELTGKYVLNNTIPPAPFFPIPPAPVTALAALSSPAFSASSVAEPRNTDGSFASAAVALTMKKGHVGGKPAGLERSRSSSGGSASQRPPLDTILASPDVGAGTFGVDTLAALEGKAMNVDERMLAAPAPLPTPTVTALGVVSVLENPNSSTSPCSTPALATGSGPRLMPFRNEFVTVKVLYSDVSTNIIIKVARDISLKKLKTKIAHKFAEGAGISLSNDGERDWELMPASKSPTAESAGIEPVKSDAMWKEVARGVGRVTFKIV